MSKQKQSKKCRYSKALAEHVLEQMEMGKNLIEICKEYNKSIKNKDLPTLKPHTITSWKRSHPEFKEEYDIAYQSRLEYLSEYIDDIAHQPLPETGDHKRDNLIMTQRKLIIDTNKFTLAKLNGVTKRQIEVEHKNAPNIVVQSFMEPIVADNDSDDETIN